MPELDFKIESAAPIPYSAAPQLAFKLRITQAPEKNKPLTHIHSVALQCQIRLEPGRRRYSPVEQEKLVELFGEPARWGQTVRSTLWANTAVVASDFTHDTLVDLPVPCTYDFNIATTKYFHALEDGEVPICLLFSGTVFYAGDDGALQILQISWEKEANYRLPVDVWKRMMEIYYPNSNWLNLRRDTFDQLTRYKLARHFTTFEQALDSLLAAQEQEATP